MITATIIMFVTGLVCGSLLYVASKYFFVEKDCNIELVMSQLGGVNCGGCGYASCAELAKSITSGNAAPSACPSLSSEQVELISSSLGVDSTDIIHRKAFVTCSGKNCITKYDYNGLADCVSMAMLSGGNKACDKGCLGGGSCVKRCSFDAIEIIDGISVIKQDKCTGCGICVSICPKNLINIYNPSSRYIVACSNTDKGAVIRKVCVNACIGCKMCKKNCPSNSITVENFLSKIDGDTCINCGACEEKCPTKAIINLDRS